MAEKEKGFGFGLGKMKELMSAVQKAQEVQEGAKKLQEELEALEVSGTAGGGLVTVIMSGNQEPRRVEIKPEALNEGSEVLADLVNTAMRAAYQSSTEIMRSRMEELTSGLGIPGM